jgi:hypothetical protein
VTRAFLDDGPDLDSESALDYPMPSDLYRLRTPAHRAGTAYGRLRVGTPSPGTVARRIIRPAATQGVDWLRRVTVAWRPTQISRQTRWRSA